MWFLQPGIGFFEILIRILAVLGSVLFSLPLHEFAHAWVATKLGDDTPKNEGRLTLNPFAHFDPIGGLCILLFSFGWAKPVPVNIDNLKSPRKNMALIAVAGPTVNFLSAIAALLILKLLVVLGISAIGQFVGVIGLFLFYYIIININLTVFNLLPVPSFDGFKILEAFIPEKFLEKYYKNLPMISFVSTLVILGIFMLGVIDRPLNALSGLVAQLITKIIGA